MPQPFDSVLFNPLVTAPMELPERVGASGRPAFAFLSVFKWEERKGWDVLLRAYLTEFARTADEVAPDTASSTADEVVLYLRVSTADQKPDLQFDGLRAYAARAPPQTISL
jgi:hypothetical protein